MLKNLVPKSSNFFECELCDYKTSRKSQYERHIATDKHQKLQKSTICQQTSIFDNNESSGLICDCGKSYKERTGLWRHKKQCVIAGTKSSGEITTELVLQLIKDNRDMQKLFMEHSQTIQQQNNTFTNMVHDVVKNGVNNNNSHNTTTNSHNKAFNLNFFLNETCKEAINMSDFVSSIKMSLDDLEHTGRNGYIEGISNIIIRNLEQRVF